MSPHDARYRSDKISPLVTPAAPYILSPWQWIGKARQDYTRPDQDMPDQARPDQTKPNWSSQGHTRQGQIKARPSKTK